MFNKSPGRIIRKVLVGLYVNRLRQESACPSTMLTNNTRLQSEYQVLFNEGIPKKKDVYIPHKQKITGASSLP